ncbi:Fic family protein [Moraxella sp.]|uniref:Fic family protein n=1 Tax=Moraxella sp. TaxID=479 RepID=UPI00262CA769|nr:Fic family protein [Moraxella sp.]MCP3896482.1 hypothetical protein [Moraxella sp.]
MPYTYLTEVQITSLNRNLGGTTTINPGNLAHAVNGPAAVLFGAVMHATLAEKAAVLVENLSQGHCFDDANKRTASAALNAFIKANRQGKGIVGGDKKAVYAVNQCADANPVLSVQNGYLAQALGKLIPEAKGGDPA